MATDDLAKAVQLILRQRGLYSGSLDGIIGPKSLGAILRALRAPAPAAEPPSPPAGEDNLAGIMADLEADEGRVAHAYQDSLGYWTIGVGRLIDKRKGGRLTDAEIDVLLRNDVLRVRAELDRRWPEWRSLSPVRQLAFQNMAFQLGVDWPAEFKNTYALIRAGDFAGAGRALRKSLWYSQTPARAERVIRAWEKG